jgi:hypothetical protein
MYENLWSKGQFPQEWRKATVIPILKPGKTLRKKKTTDSSYSLAVSSPKHPRTSENRIK